MQAVDLSDYQAIAETAQRYLDGARATGAEKLRSAFDPRAQIFGHLGEHLLADPIEALFQWHDENGPASEVVAQFSILDVTETIAVVRVEADNWTGHRFTDYLSLLKQGGQWTIVNKVFHAHQP
ncbi:MAG: nuclear transport factor 2 family protein [Rhodobacteraceae bacterium]|nr:nuclear transport factor 2 family protein [Paracoccaceae bacterium]